MLLKVTAVYSLNYLLRDKSLIGRELRGGI
jgi:hypothetical protein